MAHGALLFVLSKSYAFGSRLHFQDDIDVNLKRLLTNLIPIKTVIENYYLIFNEKGFFKQQGLNLFLEVLLPYSGNGRKTKRWR